MSTNVKAHSINMDKITLGVCYYPEHWDKKLWRDDLKRMKALGLEVIRIAEFAWNLMEPREGEYNFDFWDEFLQMATEEGIKVIFCTPTATPPAWLTEKYPETLNADADGHLLHHGMRCHKNLTSGKMLELSDALVERMGEHFNKKWDCIIGWQLDNEINCEISEYYSESDQEAFREYLKEKYEILDNLNEKMGTAFWSQSYTDWKEIHLVRRTTQGTRYTNPHMQLEQVRFFSKISIDFMARQAAILRKTAGERFITTNGIFANIDYAKLMESGLDFITYDSYPNFAYSVDNNTADPESLRDRNSSFNLARVRAISPVFGIMEQQSGPGGWNFRMRQATPKPGQMRLWTMQSIAHGADYVSYFRWRTCTFGTEIYWHGLNDYSNLPNRRIKELEGISREVAMLANVTGKPYAAKVGILTDYDNEWDGQKDQWHEPLRRLSTDGWFKALQKNHIPFDFVDFRDDTEEKSLEGYELLVYPHAAILTQERTDKLEAYVRQGGKLVMGCRTGYKDVYGRCPMTPMPGPAARLCGVRVEEFTYLSPYDGEEFVSWGDDRLPAPLFNDVLSADGGSVEGIYEGNYYDGQPALVKNELGEGSAWYYGGCFAEETAAIFLQRLGVTSPAAGWLELPSSCELAVRGEYVFVLNYEPKSCTIKLLTETKELLTGENISGDYELEPYGVLVLKRV